MDELITEWIHKVKRRVSNLSRVQSIPGVKDYKMKKLCMRASVCIACLPKHNLPIRYVHPLHRAILTRRIAWLETYFFVSYICGKELSSPGCDTRANDSKLRRIADYRLTLLIGADWRAATTCITQYFFNVSTHA